MLPLCESGQKTEDEGGGDFRKKSFWCASVISTDWLLVALYLLKTGYVEYRQA